MHLTPQVTLSEEQTCTLMSCLEEICLSEFSDAEASLEVRSTPCVNVAFRCIRHGPVLSIHLALYKFCCLHLPVQGGVPSTATSTVVVPTISICSNGYHNVCLHVYSKM